jgi:hypothetical protein
MSILITAFFLRKNPNCISKVARQAHLCRFTICGGFTKKFENVYAKLVSSPRPPAGLACGKARRPLQRRAGVPAAPFLIFGARDFFSFAFAKEVVLAPPAQRGQQFCSLNTKVLLLCYHFFKLSFLFK